MKQMLLKRKGSMAMIPMNESISMMLKLLDEKTEGKKKGEDLVKQFLSELRKAGVIIIEEGGGSNHYDLKYGKAGIEVSIHGAGQRWWSVGDNFVTKVEKCGKPWGTIFLTPDKRFWVDGCNFFRIAGDITAQGRRHVQGATLERSPSSAIPFRDIEEFILISRLSDLP